MSKIREINGNKYSKDSFENYVFRVRVDFHTVSRRHSVDLYTTQTNRDLIWEDIDELTTEKVERFEVGRISTKEQEDMQGKMLDEWLSEM